MLNVSSPAWPPTCIHSTAPSVRLNTSSEFVPYSPNPPPSQLIRSAIPSMVSVPAAPLLIVARLAALLSATRIPFSIGQ